MAYKNNETYSGKTQDILVAVTHIAKEMTENDLTEADVVLSFSDGDATIRLKRSRR